MWALQSERHEMGETIVEKAWRAIAVIKGLKPL